MDIYGIALHSALARRKHLAALLAVQLQNPLLSRSAAKTSEQIFVVDRIIEDLELDILRRCATSGPKEVQLDHEVQRPQQSQGFPQRRKQPHPDAGVLLRQERYISAHGDRSP